MFESAKEWFLSLGAEYGVDPLVFGAIYVGAIPLFTLAVAWLVRNVRQGRSPVVPALCAGACFISAYVYLLAVGMNVPAWVYAVVVVLVVGGAWSAVRSVRQKVAEARAEEASVGRAEERSQPG
ncbi:MAG: hypothetical protein AAF845_10010 [Bacteroidota bacterium]